MYPLPEDFDVGVFVGQTLEVVGFTGNTLSLTFSGEISVTVTGAVEHRCADEDGLVLVRVEEGTDPSFQSQLQRLAGAEVTHAAVDGRATIHLDFSNGGTLRLLEDTDKYECYQVEIGEKLIVV